VRFWEYAEDYAAITDGWTDVLNTHGADGWELVQAVLDEIDSDGAHVEGRHRLIFKRRATTED